MTKKQKQFIKEYLKSFSARYSAAKVYQPSSLRVADQIAHSNLRSESVRKYLNRKYRLFEKSIFRLLEI